MHFRAVGELLLLIARSVVEKGSGGLAAAVEAAAVPAAAEAAPESVLTAVAAAALAPVPAAAAPPPWLADMTAVWVSHAARVSRAGLLLLLFLEFFQNLPLSYRPPSPSALKPTHE